MTALEKVYFGMEMIKEGCAENGIGQCLLCPFASYCMGKMKIVPEDWEVEKPLDK